MKRKMKSTIQLTPEEIFKKADYYNRKASHYNALVKDWFRKDVGITVVRLKNGGIKIISKPNQTK